MVGFLARRGLFRHRTRTLLGILGVGVAGALLLDMQMLSRGLQASLSRILRDIGYEIRTRMGPSLALAIPVFLLGLAVNISFALMVSASDGVSFRVGMKKFENFIVGYLRCSTAGFLLPDDRR